MQSVLGGDGEDGDSAAVARLGRRRFFRWVGAAGVGLLPGLPSLARSPASAAVEPLRGAQLSLSVQARSVQLGEAPAPRVANAWVYCSGAVSDAPLANYLGPTIEQRHALPCRVTYRNALPAHQGAMPVPPGLSPLDTSSCGGIAAQSDVGIVAHLHGARVQGHEAARALESDGWPLVPIGLADNPYGFAREHSCHYPNDQRATLLWYHDHAMDHTGPHVHAGLAGLYFIRDAADDAVLAALGGTAQERVLVIQDRILNAAGTGFDFDAGTPDAGPNGRPEFLGDRLFVNGRPPARLALAPRAWRLRVLNGCNARTVALALCDVDALRRGRGRVWWSDRLRIIGSDGGLLARPLALAATDTVVIAPAQRRDLVVDLAGLPSGVRRLRLVNVALRSFAESSAERPEDIYSTYAASVLAPSQATHTELDATLYRVLGNGRAGVAEIDVEGAAPAAAKPWHAELERLLPAVASDDDYVWDGRSLGARGGVPFGPNRLILLISNTVGDDAGEVEVAPGWPGWNDVQIFELLPGGGHGPQWRLPFAVDLAARADPRPGAPSAAQVAYTVARGTFFARADAPDIALTHAYPRLHEPTIRARAGTYERWYVANIGNDQPLSLDDDRPDMHPFHVHLVQFVVLRRWVLDGGHFRAMAADPLDRIARQDTALIPSNTVAELLVWFPPGYSGHYVYHCHVLEHEDNCMMSSFHVA